MKKEEVNNDAILMIRKVLLVLIVLWMITVFAFSSQNGEGSGTLSHKIALLIFNNDGRSPFSISIVILPWEL